MHHPQYFGGNYAGTNMATLSILDVGSVIFGSTDNLVSYLQHRQLLADSLMCGSCAIPLNLGKKTDISDGLIFRCGTCKTTKSLRAGSKLFQQEQVDTAEVDGADLLVGT